MNNWQKFGLCGVAISLTIAAVNTSKEEWKSIGEATKKAWPKIFKVGNVLLGDDGSRNS